MHLQALMFDVRVWVMARVYHRLLDRWSRVFGRHDGIVIGSHPEGMIVVTIQAPTILHAVLALWFAKLNPKP